MLTENQIQIIIKRLESIPRLVAIYLHGSVAKLNLERTSQATIDMAMQIVAKDHRGVPQSSADGFELIYKAGKIDANLLKALKGMVGFRNIFVNRHKQHLGVLSCVYGGV